MAKNYIPGTYLEDFCFQAQQAAEKAIKAVLIIEHIEIPYVHDLRQLLLLLQNAGNDIPEQVWKSAELTPYAAVTRYPEAVRPVSLEEYQTAVQVAEDVVRWAESLHEARSP